MNAMMAAQTTVRAVHGAYVATKTKLFGLHETLVEMAAIATLVDFRPQDSYEFHRLVVEWGIEWDEAFINAVEAGLWPEDEWRERTEKFTLAKLTEHSSQCLRWLVDDDGRAILPTMDSILPAGPAVHEADTFFRDANGNKVASFGPRRLDGSGATSCVVPAVAEVPQFWGVYRHDAEGYAECVGDAVDRDSAMEFCKMIAAGCPGATIG
jgi:hypothetical protein